MKGNILVVDDEAAMRISLAEILQLEGYAVSVAENGEIALQYIEQDSFDLMLLDLKMPGMDGIEVLKKASELVPDCKVILLTAHATLDSAIEAVRMGAQDYLLKPASPGDILSSVSRAMNELTDSDRRRRLIEQLEASGQQLKDVEGIEQQAPVISIVITLGDGIMVYLEGREIWQGEKKVVFARTAGKTRQVLWQSRGRALRA